LVVTAFFLQQQHCCFNCLSRFEPVMQPRRFDQRQPCGNWMLFVSEWMALLVDLASMFANQNELD